MDFRHLYLPYCLEPVGSRWVVLNRDYKPLGMPRNIWFDYEAFAVSLRLTRASVSHLDWRSEANRVARHGTAWPHPMWLYDGHSVGNSTAAERAAYEKRLQRLSAFAAGEGPELDRLSHYVIPAPQQHAARR